MSEPDGDVPVGVVGPAGDSPAWYLAKCLAADQGYALGHVPEAAPLAEAADYVLTGGDGVGLTIACIVDRDRDPERRFTLPPERLDEIAAACRRHAGTVHGMRDAVTIEIWEVGDGVPDTHDRGRLEQYTFRQITQKGVHVKTYAVNTAPGSVGDLVSTAADGTQRQPWIRKVLKEPRRPDSVLAATVAQREKTARFQTRPVATFALLGAFLAVFLASVLWALMPNDAFLSPHVQNLIAFGALDHGQVDDGDWWRMFTCVFLHGGLMHLVFNGIAMYMAGGVLENLVGRAWMLALFFIGGLGGAMASMAVNSPQVASVGASGAIMALFAAALLISLRLPKGPARTQIQVSLAYILVPSLLPIASHGGEKVDFAAHIGGAITGAIAGGLVLLIWKRDAQAPRGRKVAAAIAIAGALATVYGFVQVAADRDAYRRALAERAKFDPALFALLVPPDQLTHALEDLPARVPRLLETHPRDPRVRFWAGAIALDAADPDLAITHLQAALDDRPMLLLLDEPEKFEATVRWGLAGAYEAKGDLSAARDAVLPSCAVGKASTLAETKAYYEKMCAAP